MENLSLNQSSYKESHPLKFIELAQEFKGVELNFSSIKDALAENVTLKDIFETLMSYNIRLVNLLGLNDFSLCSDNKFKVEIIPTLKEMINYSYKLEGDLITLTPSFESRDIPQWRIVRRTKAKLEELAKIAYKEDVKLGFEFVNLPDSSISTLEEAQKVMKPLIAQENLGYVIDTFYLTKSRGKIDDLIDLFKSVAPIFLIQLADLKSNEKEKLSEMNETQRIIPGGGEFDFLELFRTAHHNGYRRFYSIELYRKPSGYDIYHTFLNQLLSS